MINLTIDQVADVKLRLDKYLYKTIGGYSRTQIQSWIKSGFVLVNNVAVKVSYALELNDLISVQVPEGDNNGPELEEDGKALKEAYVLLAISTWTPHGARANQNHRCFIWAAFV